MLPGPARPFPLIDLSVQDFLTRGDLFVLTIWGDKQRYCDGLTRRSFLRIGALGAGLTLADALRCRAAGREATPASRKSIIMIRLDGGPPHIDMYDLKPNAPAEIRGEFKPIPTNVPGVQICELFPRQARMWDKLAVIRSVYAVHEHSDSETFTGYSKAVNEQAHHPSVGAVMSRVRGSSHDGVPTFVSLGHTSLGRHLTVGLESGYLGSAHRPFIPVKEGLGDLKLPRGMTADRLGDRKALLASFDTLRRDLDRNGTLDGLDSYQTQAFGMIATGKVRNALDLSREPIKSKERYQGIEHFLTARRMIEAGVGFFSFEMSGFDTHSQNFSTMRIKLPLVDRGVANLIQDLHDRGMDKDVVVVVWGEFGRAPKIDPGAGGGGRTHWPQAMSVLIAGGGLKMGQAIGATGARAEFIKERPYSVQQVLATIYKAVGIEPDTKFEDKTGRPVYLLDDREPIAELF